MKDHMKFLEGEALKTLSFRSIVKLNLNFFGGNEKKTFFGEVWIFLELNKMNYSTATRS